MEEESLLTTEVIEYIEKGFADDGYMYKPERLARKVMIELVKAGRAEFLLLRDDEVSKWWGDIVGGIKGKIIRHKEKVRVYELKLQAYNKLTAAERKTLGIRKPIKPKGM
jgi:hypothetical protein